MSQARYTGRDDMVCVVRDGETANSAPKMIIRLTPKFQEVDAYKNRDRSQKVPVIDNIVNQLRDFQKAGESHAQSDWHECGKGLMMRYKLEGFSNEASLKSAWQTMITSVK